MFGLSSKKGLRRRFSSSEIAGRIFQDLGPDLRDGPEGCKGTRRLRLGSERWALNPEVSEEPGGSSLDPGIMTGAQRFFDRSGDRSWNLEEPGGSSLDLEIFDWNPEAIWEHRGSSSDFIHRTRNRMANRGFSLLIGGLHMGPEFLRKSLTGLEDAGVGVMTQVPGFAAFHVWRTRPVGAYSLQLNYLIGSFPPGGSPYRKFSFSRRNGVVPGTEPGVLPSGDPEAGVLPGVFPRHDIAPVILLSLVPLRPEPHSEPGGGPVP
ncbi:hypothetical protein DY000_02006747 [Brassica cretica]|uniref:Uncharacterized protein n=1 Tax=Brassica cretica TaxID=69181 RepID=A0ABQ7BX19_BRACR|nr:hypothetical protein DY000_02006747 [Brassica cretica]